MIGPVFCLLLPVLGGCSQYVDDVPSLHALVKNQARYDHASVDVTGRVRSLRQWRSKSDGYLFQAFYLCRDRDCVHVFTSSPVRIANGELVSVHGSYDRAYRTRKAIYRNEVEATEIRQGE